GAASLGTPGGDGAGLPGALGRPRRAVRALSPVPGARAARASRERRLRAAQGHVLRAALLRSPLALPDLEAARATLGRPRQARRLRRSARLAERPADAHDRRRAVSHPTPQLPVRSDAACGGAEARGRRTSVTSD